MSTRAPLAALATLALVLSACSAAIGTPVTPEPGKSAQVTAVPGDASEPSDGVALAPWMTAELIDVRTGETFAIADLAGRLVVVEPMAIWCSNCARQQREASTVLAALDRDDIVYISLDIDPTEQAGDLATYADDRGFDWRFVVAGRDVSRMFAEAFGDQVLSPPSTPSIIITPDGELVGPTFGIRDAEELRTELESHLS